MKQLKVLTTDQASSILLAALHEAAEIGLRFSRQGAQVFSKNDTSPVTEADLAIDHHLKQRLHGDHPHIGWLSEETADNGDRLNCQQVWIVDPIDGTRGFIARTGEWAISAALVENGRPLVGVLLRPSTGDLYRAVRGGGAFCNDRRLRCSDGPLKDAKSAAGPKPYVEILRSHAADLVQRPRLASLALRIAEAAEGQIDIAFAKPRSHEWDTAAADLILSEAGGCLTSLSGDPVLYNQANPCHPPLVAAGASRNREIGALFKTGHLPLL